jgi:hypothetical protein
MNPRAAHNLNALRERIASWATRHHLDELRANVRRFLGKAPSTEEEARRAIAFAIVTAPPGGTSFIDRFHAQAGHLPRAERAVFDEWARTRFALFRVVAVTAGEGVEAHDVLADRTLHIVEREGSKQMEADMWLAAFVYEVDGRWALEGTIAGVPPGPRLAAVQAALGVYATLGVDPAAAGPSVTRQVANAVFEALAAAPPAEPAAGIPDDVFTRLDAAWPDTPLPALGDLTPREALARGRRAELWALSTSPDGDVWPAAEALLSG